MPEGRPAIFDNSSTDPPLRTSPVSDATKCSLDDQVLPTHVPGKHLDATRPPRGLPVTRWDIWQPNGNISPLYFWFLAGLCFQPHRHGCCCKCQQRALSAVRKPEDDHLHACQLHVSRELDCAQVSQSLRVAVTFRHLDVQQQVNERWLPTTPQRHYRTLLITRWRTLRHSKAAITSAPALVHRTTWDRMLRDRRSSPTKKRRTGFL